jgi:hypothetical protein
MVAMALAPSQMVAAQYNGESAALGATRANATMPACRVGLQRMRAKRLQSGAMV